MANENLEKTTENKEKKAKPAKAKKPNIFVRMFKAIGKFFRDTLSEVKKVVWPSKKQVLNNTAVVLAACIICGAVLFGIDSVFALLMRLVVKA